MRVFLVTLFVLMFGATAPSFGADVGLMDKDELKSMLGSADVVVLDVRAGRDWSSSEYKIQGAIREDPGKVSSWAGNYEKDKTLVLY